MKEAEEDTNKCWWGCGEKGTLGHCWWECKLVQPLWKTVLKKLKIELPHYPAIPFWVIHAKKMKIVTCKDSCTSMFLTALFIWTKIWKQLKYCWWMSGWGKCGVYIYIYIYKWLSIYWNDLVCVCLCVYIYIVEYYLDIKKIPCHLQQHGFTLRALLMLEGQVNKSEKVKYCMISYVESEKNQTHENYRE